MNLIEQLQQIPDYRKIRGRRHELWLVLLLILMGTMTGYWGYRPLADFTVVHRDSLIKMLDLKEDVKWRFTFTGQNWTIFAKPLRLLGVKHWTLLDKERLGAP